MNCLRIVILFFIQSFSLLSFSQKGNPKFTHLTTSDGLSQNTVFSILKDHKGFMWFATDEGLNKYDGYKFTVYKHDPQNNRSIRDNTINTLLEDSDHNFWVVSAAGLDKFDRLKESFIHYKGGDNGVIFKSIFQDTKKRIWLSTTGGFCLFDILSGKFKFYKNKDKDANSLTDNYVYKITEDNYGKLWIATRGGLDQFDPVTEKFSHYKNDPGNNKSIGSGYIKSVYKDSKGNIWAGTQGSGIALFNRQDNSFSNFKHDPLNKKSICYNDILSFAEDAYGKLWIGTENGGISVYDYSTNNFDTYQYNDGDPASISGNSVYSLYKDDIGNMWAGTWSGGVNFLPFFGDKFTSYRKLPNNNSLSNNIVLSIHSDQDNNIWIGTDGGGLDRFDSRTHHFTNYRNNKDSKTSMYSDYVLSISDYSPGILALGFHRGGIDLFDVQKQAFTHYAPGEVSPNSRISPSVNIVYTDRQHNLWVGTHNNGGLYLFDKRTSLFDVFYADRKSVSDSSVFTVLETGAGQLWIGGDKGLDLFDKNTKGFIHHQHDPKNKQSLSNNSVFSIMEDHAGNLWLGTAGGLNFFNIKTKQFTAYTEEDGLPNNTVWSTQEDKHGNLWVSTNKGLSRFTPSTKIFRNYTVIDGLQGNSFKAKSSYQSRDGEMYFGGANGFNTFYPDSIKDNDFVPPVYLTDFQVFNKPVGIGGNSPLQQSLDEVKEITLSHKESVFTLEFAALNFTQPQQNRYAYKLEGFDEEWNYVGNKRTATYTNLDPGTYTFRVKASNNDGVWNEKGIAVKITITPPFWLTWWFRGLLFLLIVGGCVSFYLFRMNIIEKQKVLLEQKVKEQTIQLVLLNEEERKSRLEAEQSRTESDIARQEAEKARGESEIARHETWAANEKLQIKNKELEQFAFVVSHDLQEPLRTTAGFVDLLQQQYRGKIDEKADKYLAFISDSTARMKVLIQDLLEFSRVGAKLELSSVDCNVILKNMLADIMAAIQEAKADIQFTGLPVINGYPTEIKLLFQNLVINAIKFRKKDTAPQIDISVKKINDCWQFAFKDNGIGIAKQNSERIFDIFQRLHSRTEYEGSGIGLSHCKKIVELHQGKIWVESIAGEGSTFYFTIPDKKIQ